MRVHSQTALCIQMVVLRRRVIYLATQRKPMVEDAFLHEKGEHTLTRNVYKS